MLQMVVHTFVFFSYICQFLKYKIYKHHVYLMYRKGWGRLFIKGLLHCGNPVVNLPQDWKDKVLHNPWV